MTLQVREFIRRFLMRVLTSSYHRMRYYGLLRQRGPCRQHRARPPDAGRAIAPDGWDQTSTTDTQRPKTPEQHLVRRPHDHHRDLRGAVPASSARRHTKSGSTHMRSHADRYPPRHSRLQLARRRPRPSSHPSHRFAASLVPELRRHHARRPYIPRPTPVPPAKTTAATNAIEHPAARSRHKIPIAPAAPATAAPPPLTSRDFVLWRFSDAGFRSARIVSSCRRPKTCTTAD